MILFKKMRKAVPFFLACALLLSACESGDGSVSDVESKDEASGFISSVSEEVESSEQSYEVSFENQSEEASAEDNLDSVINVSFVASEGGYVSGNVKQALKSGDVTKAVTATPILCYRFKEWSDGVTEQTRGGDSFEADTVITAIFEYAGLPEIHIDYKGTISKNRETKATYTVKNACGIYEFEGATGFIEGRGNATWKHAKKPYKIEFDESVNLLGIGENAKHDWVLIANHADQSLFRNYFSYNMGYQLGIGYKSTLCEVYFNGKYHGVYMLTGQVEESRLDVDVSEGGYIIELDRYYSGKENVNYVTVGKEHYTLKSDYVDAKQMAEIKSYIQEINAALDSKDKDRICELIDIESCVNMYLLQEYTKNTDAGWSSFYMYKRDAEDKLHFGPAWDFDIAMGNDYRLDKGSYENIYVGRYSGFTQQNWWFIYLCRMEWFRELALQKWNTDFYGRIADMLDNIKETASLNWDELENNFVRWDKVFGNRINCEPVHIMELSSYSEHFRFFMAWMELRLDWLDDCFNNEEFWLKEINDRTYPQYKGGRIPEIEKDSSSNVDEEPSEDIYGS